MGQRDGSASVLTRRQAEILAMIADDLTDSEIAARLNLKHSTVVTHGKLARKALGVNTRAGAVARMFRLGELS